MSTSPFGTNGDSGHGKSGVNGATASAQGPFGHSYKTWRLRQHGQETLIRWGTWREEFPQLRVQNGYQHVVSVTALIDEKSALMARAGYPLDREMLFRCATNHDVAEGILQIDVAAPRKKDSDDLREYLAFRQAFEPLGSPHWPELHEAFLLQTCLKNPACFPEDARSIMTRLAKTKSREAMFFRAIEIIDYLYTATEGTLENGIEPMAGIVALRYIDILDDIASKLPGFQQTVWTLDVRSFFADRAKNAERQDGLPPHVQMLLFVEED